MAKDAGTMDQTVELFCGKTKAFSSLAVALGFSTFTVDLNPEAAPNLVADIRSLPAEKLPTAPLIIWAAPPVSPTFTDRKSWQTDGSFVPATSEAEDAIGLVRATIGLMTALKPTWWFLESPKSLLRGMPLFAGFNRGYPTRNRLTFRSDEWGGSSDAETDVWTNAYWWLPRAGERDGAGGLDTGRRIPPFALATMFEHLERYRNSKR